MSDNTINRLLLVYEVQSKRIAELERQLSETKCKWPHRPCQYGMHGGNPCDERISELERQQTDLHAENMCDACGGNGKSISGIPCMCGGSGKMSDAARWLRRELVETQERQTDLLAALTKAKFVMDHLGDYINGMDIVDIVERETGVPNERIYEAFHAVDAAIERAEARTLEMEGQ